MWLFVKCITITKKI